ncbi:MAG: DUF1015 domain-containing protein [Acidimicrobiia bacterium]|nr:DUF1015 domain-containing protein [Acidimicrobiia bacterium]
MPRCEPFRALRYKPGTDLDAVIAPPYDVVSEADVDELAARDAHNIVHVDVPRGGPDRYAAAAGRLRSWIADDVLVADDEPTFTLYRMRFTDAAGVERDLVGVLGGVEVVDEGAGGVLPHERTTPKASTDRLDLTRATAANLSPIWGLSLATGLTALLTEPAEPVGAVTVDGVEHTVERVRDPERIAAIRDHLSGDDVLIADGHHRYAISRTYRDEVRAATGRTDTAAEQTLAFVGELVADQVSIEAIHRLYSGVPAVKLREALAGSFAMEPADLPGSGTLAEMGDRGRLLLLEPGGGATWLIPDGGALAEARALDGAWLEHALAVAGLADDVEVRYQHGLTETSQAVEHGEAAAAVLIRPVSIAEIQRTAREGLLMPPKSTFFTPKLRTGFVVRDLTTG